MSEIDPTTARELLDAILEAWPDQDEVMRLIEAFEQNMREDTLDTYL